MWILFGIYQMFIYFILFLIEKNVNAEYSMTPWSYIDLEGCDIGIIILGTGLGISELHTENIYR